VTGEAPTSSGGPTFIEFAFVCTDKGQHRRYPLLRAMVRPESDDLLPLAEHTSFRPAGRESTFGASDYDDFYCAGCGRNTRVIHQKLMAAIRQLQEAGISELDVSLLPF